eukprot:266450-Pyramimonas_sp.AAC.1
MAKPSEPKKPRAPWRQPGCFLAPDSTVHYQWRVVLQSQGFFVRVGDDVGVVWCRRVLRFPGERRDMYT